MNNKVDDPRWDKAKKIYNSGDWSGALFLLKSMANDGIKRTYSKIAYIYEFGYNGKFGPDNGVNQDFDKALKWYRKAYYESFTVETVLGLVRIYIEGKGVQRDYERAFRYLSEIERYHHPDAYYMLGVLYQTGNGVTQDLKKAKTMFMRAAVKGNRAALGHIGGVIGKSGHPVKGLCIQILSFIKMMTSNIKEISKI